MTPLEADGWRLELLPEIGGAIGSPEFRGVDVLRPAALHASDPLETACFPMVPFANRVANDSVTFGGRKIRRPTFDRFHPHALHGEVWLKPWSVVAACDRSVALQFCGGESWPWPYASRQTTTLGQCQAIVDLERTNAGATAMPAGLGPHPYFLFGPDARLTFKAADAWLGEPGGIPKRFASAAELFDFSDGIARIESLSSITATQAGEAQLRLKVDHTVAISMTPNVSWVHVYCRQGS